MKPGIKTTEFWAAAIVSVASLAAVVGLIGPTEQSILVEGGNQIVAGVREVVLGITTIAPVVVYIWSRVKLKLSSK